MGKKAWYVITKGKYIGPLETSELLKLALEGGITQKSKAWCEGMDKWEKASSIEALAEAFPTEIAQNLDTEKTVSPANKTSNYFVQHWRGELSLAKSWWLNYYLLTAVFVVSFNLISNAFDLNVSIYLLFALLILVIYLWGFVGVWRSANAHIDSAIKWPSVRSKFWGRVAKIFLIIGAFPTLGAYVLNVSDTYNLFAVADSEIFQRYYITELNESDILFAGWINENSVSDILAIFDADENKNAILIDSGGGILQDAFRLADYIQDNNIVVVAQNECVSACTLILASSNLASAEPMTRIVFHHPEPIVEFSSSAYREAMNVETLEFYQRFEDAGVPLNVLEEFKSVSYTPLSNRKAAEIGIIDWVWDRTTMQYFDPLIVCGELGCNLRTDSATNQIGAIVNIFNIKPEQCFEESEDGIYTDLPIISCELLHDYEVFASFEITEPELPAEENLEATCGESFESYVGAPYESSELYYSLFYPLDVAFGNGERTVICVLYALDDKFDFFAKNSSR